MAQAAELIELWRGEMREGVHCGHAVIHDGRDIVASWGDADAVIYPRSSCKMIQALPLVASGAARAAGLGPRQLALACASHNGAALHVDSVRDWTTSLGLSEADFRCGSHMPRDPDEKRRLICSDTAPCQLHNNCSGKHAGFLTLNQHLGADAEYLELDHPIQRAIREASEQLTQEPAAAIGIDGCSAPNFACSVTGLARAMAAFATPTPGTEGQARADLVAAMRAHPELVAGEGRACTGLMRAMQGRVAVKTGAEAVYTAILPERGLGIALKIVDGGTRAAEAAITALLIQLGELDPAAPIAGKLLSDPHLNARGLATGGLRLAPGFAGAPTPH